MDYEAALISKVIFERSIREVLEYNLQNSLFQRYPEHWEFLQTFYRNHGITPPIEQFEKLYPNFELQLSEYPYSFFIEELRKRRTHNIAMKAMKDMAPLLKKKKPLEALEIMRQAVLKAEIETRPARDINLAENPLERLVEYDELSKMGGITGLPTLWPILDEVTLGFHDEELIMIVARGGVGKSWCAVILACHFWSLGYVPLLFTKEMAVKQIAQRFDSVYSRVGYQGLRAGTLAHEEYERYQDSLEKMDGALPFWVSGDDEAGGVSGISAKIDRYNPRVVIIDGGYLIEDERKGDSGWQRLNNVAWDLKCLARNKKLPLVVTYQFNKEAGEDKGTADTISFGDIQKWFDVIIGMYQTEDLRLNKEMLFKLLKHREGERIEFVADWNLESMEFTVKGMGRDDLDNPEAIPDEEELVDF